MSRVAASSMMLLAMKTLVALLVSKMAPTTAALAVLAAEMGNSRSVFAERFMAVTGATPVRHLTELRMQLATQWIARDQQSIDRVAQKLGCNSQAAFSRAFKRVVGAPPSAVRSPAGLYKTQSGDPDRIRTCDQ